MLVLTRKAQEVIHIGNNITIAVVRISKNAVRIGIDAPRDVQVRRGELPAVSPSSGGENRTIRTPQPEAAVDAGARPANRLPRYRSLISRAKSLTVVALPCESSASRSGLMAARLRDGAANSQACGAEGAHRPSKFDDESRRRNQ